MKKFPKMIYVDYVDLEHQEGYFEVNTDVKYLPDEDCQIAIYELKEVKNLSIKKELK